MDGKQELSSLVYAAFQARLEQIFAIPRIKTYPAQQVKAELDRLSSHTRAAILAAAFVGNSPIDDLLRRLRMDVEVE